MASEHISPEVTTEEEKNNRKWRWITILMVLLLALTAIIGAFILRDGDKEEPAPAPSPSSSPSVTVTPTPTPTVTETPKPVVKEIDIKVDGKSYTTLADLKTAMKSPSWVDPKFECMAQKPGDPSVYYTAHEKAEGKDSENGKVSTKCLIIITEPTQVMVDLLFDPNAVGAGDEGTYAANFIPFSFDEFINWQDKYNESAMAKPLPDSYFYYDAINDYRNNMLDTKLYRTAQMPIDPRWTVEDGVAMSYDPLTPYNTIIGGHPGYKPGYPETTMKTKAQEAEYRKGWAYAEKITGGFLSK